VDYKPSPVEVRTSVSQTAVWVGDRVSYVIEFQSAPQVEILADDLAPDRLDIDGLEVVDTATERDASKPDRVIHRFRYDLVTYEIEAPSLTIAAIPVRFSERKPGQRAEDAQPVGEVTVPPLVLGLRSTVPPSSAAVTIRDEKTTRPVPTLARIARPAGIALVVLSIVPVALWAVALVQRFRHARPKRRSRHSAKERRAEFDALRTLDVTSEATRRDAYARLDAWVRDQLAATTGVAAAALTPSEIPSALPRPPRQMTVDELQRLLEECERAKFAPDLPPSDRWPILLDEAEQLLGARAR
jgi:hypothetical protein